MASTAALIASVLLNCMVLSSAFNITAILDGFPNFSQFNQLLTSSGVDQEINNRNSITVLAPANDAVGAFLASNPNVDTVKLADLLRYHVLLEYFGLANLQALDTDNYTSVTTLYQTTGRANENDGFLNIYNLPTGILIGPSVPGSSANATVVANVTEQPFNISIVQIDRVLTQPGFSNATTDLIKILESFSGYTQFIKYLKDSAVDQIFAGRQTGNGITVFAPKDSAFTTAIAAKLPALNVTDLKLLMQYHALASFQTFDSLLTIVDGPVTTIASTVATGYRLNASGSDETLTLLTGVNNATVVQLLYSARPTNMFGIDNILLPTELFQAADLAPAPAPEATNNTASPPVTTKGPGAAPSGPVIPDSPSGSDAVAKISVAMSMLAVIASSLVAAL